MHVSGPNQQLYGFLATFVVLLFTQEAMVVWLGDTAVASCGKVWSIALCTMCDDVPINSRQLKTCRKMS